MEERVIKHFSKEEEFLEEFGDLASIASRFLNHDWMPNYTANDESRRSDAYFLSARDAKTLVFKFATIYHNEEGFSSLQLILESSYRTVNIQVKKVKDEFVAQKIVDNPK